MSHRSDTHGELHMEPSRDRVWGEGMSYFQWARAPTGLPIDVLEGSQMRGHLD
jgi:hypothetical protein